MKDRKKPSDEETLLFWAALADDLAASSSDSLKEDLLAAGEDPSVLASEVRQLLRDAVKESRQQPLREARKQHTESLKRLLDHAITLPADMLRKRAILAELFARRPELVTAQFRDLESVSDSDVDGMIRQMMALGILSDRDNK